MTALATSYDCELRLGRELSSTEARRVDALLTDASATIRSYTGQRLDQAVTTARLRSRRRQVLLPQRPVNEVTGVVDLDGNAVDWTWQGGDIITVGAPGIDPWATVPFTTDTVAFDVTYDHGYEVIPDDIVGICASITLRALGQNPAMGGLTQESIEGYSYSIGPTGAAGGLGLLPAERELLDRYRRRVGRIDQVGLP